MSYAAPARGPSQPGGWRWNPARNRSFTSAHRELSPRCYVNSMFDGWIATFDDWVATIGGWGYPVLGVASLFEYIAPPFPGDTIVLLGGAYAARGERSAVLVLLAVTIGSMVGTAFMWWVGRLLRRGSGHGRWSALRKRLEPSLLAATQGMQTHGTKVLLLHRFLPTLRTVTLVAAGAAGLPFGRVFVLGTLSALGWNSLLVTVGMVVGHHAERLDQLVRTYKIGALVIVAGVLAWLVWRSRKPVPRGNPM
jgi:membrane protein DedA with SNARE-associated domain